MYELCLPPSLLRTPQGLGSQLLLLGFALAPTETQKSAVRAICLWFAVSAAGLAVSGRPLSHVAGPIVAFAAFAAAYYSALGGAGFPPPKALPPGPLRTCLLVNAGACAAFALAGTLFVDANLASLGLVRGTPAFDGVRLSQRLDAVVLAAHGLWARELALVVGDPELARRALYAWAVQAAACAYVTYTDAPASVRGSVGGGGGHRPPTCATRRPYTNRDPLLTTTGTPSITPR